MRKIMGQSLLTWNPEAKRVARTWLKNGKCNINVKKVLKDVIRNISRHKLREFRQRTYRETLSAQSWVQIRNTLQLQRASLDQVFHQESLWSSWRTDKHKNLSFSFKIIYHFIVICMLLTSIYANFHYIFPRHLIHVGISNQWITTKILA